MTWYASLTRPEQMQFWVAVASVIANTIAVVGLLVLHARVRRLPDADTWCPHLRTLRIVIAVGWIMVVGLIVGPAIRTYFGQPQPWRLIGLMEATVVPILITVRFARDTLLRLTAPAT